MSAASPRSGLREAAFPPCANERSGTAATNESSAGPCRSGFNHDTGHNAIADFGSVGTEVPPTVHPAN